jgi:translation initiation factor eIF-2B subunit delta
LEDELLSPHAASSSSSFLAATAALHPAVIQLGRDYASGAIRGGNARCRAMLQCFALVLSDYQPPHTNSNNNSTNNNNNNNTTTHDIRQQLEQDVLKPSFDFWTNHCRPHSVSMGNAFTFFKTAVATLDRDWSWETMRQVLVQETIPAYLTQRLEYSDAAIAQYAVSKLQLHEVLLTFGYSEVIQHVLETAWRRNDKLHQPFRVIVVDSRPLLEGRRMVQALRQAGLEHVTYIYYHSLTYVMPTVTKVLLGASALMSNGSVLGRIGTAGIALAAKAHQVPVLVCCESYKISNRVQLESITHNELGPAFALFVHDDGNDNENEERKREDHKMASSSSSLQVLNLMYDLTHSELVSGVITEMGILPPTSVAVLLREMNPLNQTSG